MSRPVRWPYLTAGLVALIGWGLGVAATDAALFGCVLLVALLVAVAVRRPAAEHRWPDAPPPEPDGARRDVFELTTTFAGAGGRVSESAVRRLRGDATRRLARRGVLLPATLGPDTPAAADPDTVRRARSLLGDRAWRILTSPGGVMPSFDDVVHCVDLIERLVPPDRPTAVPERPPT